jgi:hypothetical protein
MSRKDPTSLTGKTVFSAAPITVGSWKKSLNQINAVVAAKIEQLF